MQARRIVRKKPLSKAQIEAISRKKALKRGTSIFDPEKLALTEAIQVLRVRTPPARVFISV